MDWCHTHMCQLSIGRDISAAEVPPWGAKGPSSILGSPAHNPCMRKKTPQNIWLWKSEVIPSLQVRRKAARNPGIFFKGPADKHPPSHSPWALAEGQNLGVSRGKWRETELCGSSGGAGGMTTIVLVLSPSLMQLAGRHHLSCDELSPNVAESESALAWWILLALPWWLPETPPHLTPKPPLALSQAGSQP